MGDEPRIALPRMARLIERGKRASFQRLATPRK